MKVPTTVPIEPIDLVIKGKSIPAHPYTGKKAKPTIVVVIRLSDPDSKRSAPRPAQSPTLSPTWSAITAGFLGSSSGMPFSTLPTRSADISAAFV